MKKIVLILIIISTCAYSQVTQEWVARYNGPGNNTDEAKAIAVDNFGNVYVTGYANYVSGQVFDIITIKYNSSGLQQWFGRYNGPGNYLDEGNGIVTDNLGNVYVTGMSSQSSLRSNYVTIKYSPSGIQEWIAIYPQTGPYRDEAYSIAIDRFGNIYVTGECGGTSNFDYVTVKYNSSGVQQWDARYTGEGGYDIAVCVKTDSFCNVYVTGRSNGPTGTDYATVKYDSSGVQLWATRYNGPGNSYDEANSLAIDNLGNVYVTGYSCSSSSLFSADYATVKYNSAGIQQWVQRYDGSANEADVARSITIDPSGNVYITGSIEGVTTSGDYATIKYDSSGYEEWVQIYNYWGYNRDEAYSIVVDNLSNVYVTGKSVDDYTTIKYNLSGVQQWLMRYSGPGSRYDRANSIALDYLGNVYVTGVSDAGSPTFRDYATIKYSQIVGVQPISTEIPEQFSLSQNYPNPFNPTTNIKFEIPKSSFVKLVVYDILGREITRLAEQEMKAGSYAVDWDASNYPSGVYFYRLETDEFSEAKKMVLIK